MSTERESNFLLSERFDSISDYIDSSARTVISLTLRRLADTQEGNGYLSSEAFNSSTPSL